MSCWYLGSMDYFTPIKDTGRLFFVGEITNPTYNLTIVSESITNPAGHPDRTEITGNFGGLNLGISFGLLKTSESFFFRYLKRRYTVFQAVAVLGCLDSMKDRPYTYCISIGEDSSILGTTSMFGDHYLYHSDVRRKGSTPCLARDFHGLGWWFHAFFWRSSSIPGFR